MFSYLFPVFPYSFLLPYKNMKTNVAALSSIRFRSVFIPTLPPHFLLMTQLLRSQWTDTTTAAAVGQPVDGGTRGAPYPDLPGAVAALAGAAGDGLCPTRSSVKRGY
jgi:hypothetical protein